LDGDTVAREVGELAAEFARQRGERQRRRHLDPADFARLAGAGFPLTGVPAAEGGLWEGVPRSTRLVAELLRTLAGGDSSVALVSAMHPAVLSFWLATPRVPAPFQEAWDAQRRRVSRTVLDGAWWGTITSEPGSGGDVAQSRAVARPDGGAAGGTTAGPLAYRLTGQKHFGSGSGVTSYMLTSARPDEAGGGEPGPDWFFLDVRGAPWDGSRGMRLVAEWDGHGMAATQSHAFAFEGFPAERFAWPGHLGEVQTGAAPFVACCFTAVIVGVAETAVATARAQLAPRRASLRAYERMEWARAETETWLIRQAYEGMLRAVEAGEAPDAGSGATGSDEPAGSEGAGGPEGAALATLRGKTAIAGLAERVTGRLCRVLGGGTYARGSPYGAWFEDVRALGFLRPPWGLAFDRLFEGAWED
jgi:alkylation response protein AidB-like acyl-CoA dehydrogenase